MAGPLGLARWDVVVLRSPGTPAAGLVLLDGYLLFGRAEYLAAARRTSDLLLATQLAAGGWFSEVPVADGRMVPWFAALVHTAAIDDDVTPGATRLLLRLWKATGEQRHRAGAERALALLLAAQLPSGAWPLTVRPAWARRFTASFADLAATNDGATPAAIETLLLAGRMLGRPDLLSAARRGGDWLVASRRPPPQAAWAQQYAADGAPAPARPFEPAALATWETRYVLDTLLVLAAATGDRRYCAPVPAAMAWLARSALRPGCWARFHALGTNAPLYATADGFPTPRLAEARPGYSWTGPFGIPSLLARVRGEARARLPPRPLPGDPGTCPGDTPTGVDADLPGDARAHVARAGELLAALAPSPPAPCRAGRGGARRR